MEDVLKLSLFLQDQASQEIGLLRFNISHMSQLKEIVALKQIYKLMDGKKGGTRKLHSYLFINPLFTIYNHFAGWQSS